MKLNPVHLIQFKESLRLEEKPEKIPGLIKDENVRGTVLKSLDRGKALLLIKGRCVKARTAVPLAQGKEVSFRVKETRPAW